MEGNPDNKALLMPLVMTLDSIRRKEQALEYAKKALKLDADYVPALNYIGYTFAEMGINLDEAERLVRKAVELSPDDGFILDSLGWVYFRKGKVENAIRYLRKAHELVPDDPVIAEHLADAYAARQMFDRAVEVYRQAVKNAKKGEEKRRLKRKLEKALENLSDIPDI